MNIKRNLQGFLSLSAILFVQQPSQADTLVSCDPLTCSSQTSPIEIRVELVEGAPSKAKVAVYENENGNLISLGNITGSIQDHNGGFSVISNNLHSFSVTGTNGHLVYYTFNGLISVDLTCQPTSSVSTAISATAPKFPNRAIANSDVPRLLMDPQSIANAKCPDDYYGVYAITPNDYVDIGTSETRQIVIIFANNECVATVNGPPSVTNAEANGNAEHVSCSISCDSNGILDLNIDRAQHKFSKNGNDLVVDGKTYPTAAN